MATPAVGLAVLGAGRIGAVHARNAARSIPGASLVGIGDVDVAAAQRLARDAGCSRAGDVASLLADPAVHAVVVATPTGTHADLIDAAARAKKHVFCEKPISLEIGQTKRAIAAATRAGILLQVGFQRRFDAAFVEVQQRIARGDLGTLRFLRLVSRDHRMPSIDYLRTSGGQYRDQMIHDFDAARWLFGPATDVAEVYATGSALVDPQIASFGDVDTAVAVMRAGNGALCVADVSRETTFGYDIRVEAHGSKGMALSGYQRYSGDLIDERAATPDVDSFIERFADAYRAELADFVSCVREERAPRVGGAEALEALRIAMAADRSLAERRPVRLTEVGDD